MRPALPRMAGFTLIELMVTLTILALLASIIMPLAEISALRQREQTLQRALWTIRDAIDEYKRAADQGRVRRNLDDSGYPPNLRVLEEGVTDQRNPTGAKIYFIRRIPRDPFCNCPQRQDADTWGLRAYGSPPDSPQAGRDVYDVYTLHEGTGLDGTPLREW